MNKLNFATYGNIIKNGIADSTNESVVRLLIEFIILEENVTNTNNEPYDICTTNSHRWLSGKESVPRVIKRAADSFNVKSLAYKHFDEIVIPSLSTTTEDDVYSALISLINSDDSISIEKKDTLISLYEDNKVGEFLAETFLYAIQKDSKIKNNKKSKDKDNLTLSSIGDSLNEIMQLYKKIPSPEKIHISDEIHRDEGPYTKELLRAFADAKEVDEISKEDLNKYPKYKKNFERQRKYYYSAESVRMLVRDISCSEEVSDFDLLKEEAYNCVIDVHEDDYDNGLERLNSVLKHASIVNMDKSIIVKSTNWIGANEKKGLCHMLVNDGELKWVDDDE